MFVVKGFGDKLSSKPFYCKKIMPNKIKIILSFSFILTFSISAFSQEDSKPKSGNGIGNAESQKTSQNDETATKLRILSKVPSKYTDAARKNAVEGSVRLNVTLLASGEIGSINPVTNLPFGLTEQAIAAARQIKFTPASKNGVPITITKLVEYHFSIYYRENDKELKQNAELLETPAPERPQGGDWSKIAGKVKLEVALNSDGGVQVIRVSSDLPKEFEEKAIEAASKIKFKPAIHKNENKVSQVKEIEYEFKAQ
jgi:TonB family protein